MPRPSSTTVTELSMWMVTLISLQWPASASIYRVVHDLVDEVVQARLVARRPDVHGGAHAHHLRPSRMRMASAPYWCDARPRGSIRSRSCLRSLARGQAQHPAFRDVVDPAEASGSPPRPGALGGQGLPPARDLRAQGARALRVELGVEVVQERHRRAAGLLVVDRC